MQISKILTKAASNWPEKIAVICGELKLTYQILFERCNKLADFFVTQGLQPGTRVAIIHPNCHIFLESYFAAAMANLILTPINVRLSVNELFHIFQDSGTELLIAHSDYYGLINDTLDLLKDNHNIKSVIWTANSDDNKEFSMNIESFYYNEIITNESGRPLLVDRKDTDIAHLYYTSGTTGNPKGVPLTHSNVILHSEGAIDEFKLSSSDVWGHIAPMYHLADAWATFAITMVGGTHIMVPKFEPKPVLESIQNNGITITNLIPTMLNMLVNYPEVKNYNNTSFRCLLSGGAPIAPELVKKVINTFKCEYIQTYGMTETSPYLTVSILKEHLSQLPEEKRLKYISRTGRAFKTIQLKIVNEFGMEVQTDDREVGEVWVRGPTITTGYWHDPEETKAAFKDGWLLTGDLAVIDSEGYINIVDRKKDMIITGGENVYSTEVEHVLYEHPDILEAAVIGVADEKWGEKVVAIVVPKAGVKVDPDDVIDFCKMRMAAFKVPKVVEIIDELPKTGSGKIAKGVLKARYLNK